MIETFVAWSTPISIWAESMRSEGLTALFKFFAALGDTKGYMMIAPWVYWFFRVRRGLTLFFTIMIAYLLMALLKSYFALPRPFVSGVVTGLEDASSYSFPSGHSMIGMAFWLFLSLSFRHRLLWAWSILSVLLIGFSRIYLGVHYLSDVLVGWTIGAIIAFTMFSRSESLEKRYENRALMFGVGGVLLVGSLLCSGDVQKALGYLSGGLISIGFLSLKDLELWQKNVSHVSTALLGTLGIATVLAVAFAIRKIDLAPYSGAIHSAAVSITIVWLLPRLFLARSTADS